MTDATDRAVQVLAKKIADCLSELVHAERPTQDVWWEALGLAVADSVVRNVTAYEALGFPPRIARTMSVLCARVLDDGGTPRKRPKDSWGNSYAHGG